MTPLHEAARSGNTEVVTSYVQAKRNLDPRWDEPSRGLEGNYARLIGLTPLMLAARYGQLEVAKLLVDGGADIYAQANTQLPGEPLTTFDFAVQGGHLGIAEYLWEKSDGVRLGKRLADQIASACNASCKEGAGTAARSNLALFLISVAPDEVAGAGVGLAACYSLQPLDLLAFVEKYAARPPRNTLHCMAYQTFSRHRPLAERLAVLTWMLDHGADLNGQLHGWTPLMGTATAQDIDTAKLLVARGANPNLSGTYLPPIAAGANSCVNVTNADAVDARIDAQLAMVQYLAPLSDKKVYASHEVLKKADLIGRCCARQPQTASQRRICEVFGL
jgi:ankyrin repeat protein